jgi:hypothetical protein
MRQRFKGAAIDDLVGLDHPADIEGDLAFCVVAIEIGAFQCALARGEEVLAIDRADALTAVVGAWVVIDGALTKHG